MRNSWKTCVTCIFCSLMDEAMTLETTTYHQSSGKMRQRYETGKYVIERGNHFIAVKPFASRYEWEIHILPILHQGNYLEASIEELSDLAGVIRRTMSRLEAVVGEVQYNYFLHTLPHGQDNSDSAAGFHWHIEICPRTSIPSGFELGSGLFVNTISPEDAAFRLRQAIVND